MSSLNGRNLTVCVCHKIQVPSKSIQNQFLHIFNFLRLNFNFNFNNFTTFMSYKNGKWTNKSVHWLKLFFFKCIPYNRNMFISLIFYLWCTNILTRFFYFILSSISCLETIITFFLLCMNYIIIKIKYIFV